MFVLELRVDTPEVALVMVLHGSGSGRWMKYGNMLLTLRSRNSLDILKVAAAVSMQAIMVRVLLPCGASRSFVVCKVRNTSIVYVHAMIGQILDH